MNQWTANIRKFYYFRFFTVFSITNPILFFYMLEKGLSVGTIFLLSGIQRVFGILIEVPTGALSDLKGHKYNLMLGTLSFSISCLVFAWANSFWGFLLAEIFMALSAGFISGADTAFVYESLERNNLQATYEKVFGQMKAIQSAVSAVVILIVGFLAELSWGLPFYIGALFGLISFAISCTFVEPGTLIPHEGVARERYRKYYGTITQAIKICFTNVQLRWFLVYSSVLAMGLTFTEDFYQVYMKEELILPVAYSGVIYAVLYVGQAFFSNYTSLTLNKLGYEKMFYLMPALGIVTALGMVFFKNVFVIVLFMLPYISLGLNPTVASGYMNRRTNPGQRATVGSLRMMMRKVSYAILSPIVGWVSDFWGMQVALLMAVGFLLLAMALPPFYKQRYQLDYECVNVEVQTSSAR